MDATSNYYIYPGYLNSNNANNIQSVNFNSWLVNATGATQIWRVGTSNYNNYNGYKGDVKVGTSENYTNPQWVDFAKLDMRSNAFETQNNKPTSVTFNQDLSKKLRNLGRSDRGALENYMDITATKTSFSLASSVCAGHETTADITIKNTFVDTIYNFFVAYSINGKATRELVTQRILPGDSLLYKFKTPVVLEVAGQTVVKIYLDINDDYKLNDTFSFNTLVKPAPGGGFYEFSTKTTTPNTAIYQRGKPNDITVINQPVIYDVRAPRIYNNSTYGTSSPANWYATAQAYTASGRAVTGATLTPPSGSTNLEVQFKTADATLEDSMITVVLKVTDNNNGCDTFIRRRVLIYPSIVPDFTFPAKICNEDEVLFTNTSTVRSGAMEFFWNFGTGNAADTSNAPEPVFEFPSAGKYKVTMTAKTLPYGFVFTKIYDVTVNAIPSVAFDKANACLGQDLVFTNKTNPLTSKMTWEFGNGATATTTDAKYKYSKPGTYNVTLSADLNGCVAKLTQKVYQFEKPVAKFTHKSGTCDNDQYEFTNQTTISGGLVGSFWNFDDNGSVSTDEEPKYTFSAPGKKNVKLVALSEFGCKDSMVKSVEVKESPKAGFTNTPACSLTPTVFTNTTADVAGAIANYDWSFGDGTTSKTKSPSKNWTNLGPKMVTLVVTLDNGCKDEVSKELSVLTQPKANFSASDVCAGDQVVFVNNTTWPQGDISYNWDFGDNTYSTNSDPSKLYNIVQTTSYNVTLYAYIAGGCADSITQRVTVNESPRTCDFQATPNYGFSYHGVKVEPVNSTGVAGGQNNVDYTWVFAGGGTLKSKDVNAAVNYDLQSDGEYTVTMKAVVRQTGCECSKTKKIVMNRAAVKDLQSVGVAVYPNPTAGDIKVATTETFGANITVNVMSIEGKMVSSRTVANEGVMVLNTDGLSNGVYLVQVMSGDKQVTKKITVQK
jgi:PKD repeat protein